MFLAGRGQLGQALLYVKNPVFRAWGRECFSYLLWHLKVVFERVMQVEKDPSWSLERAPPKKKKKKNKKKASDGDANTPAELEELLVKR